MADQLYEHFNELPPGHTYAVMEATFDTWPGQTFTPQISHQMNKVRLKLFCSGEIPGWLVILHIRNVNPITHLPIGTDIYDTWLPAEDLPIGEAAADWIDFPVTPPLSAVKDTEYAILLSALPPM